MAMTRMFMPSCDADTARPGTGCLGMVDWGEWTSDEAKARARQEGWHIRNNRYVCPPCWDGGQR